MYELKITGNTAKELAENLIHAAELLREQPAVPSVTMAPVAPPVVPTAAPVAPVALPAATPVVPMSAPTVAAVPVAPTPVITLDQVGKAGADLIAVNPAKMQELLGLLAQFGVQAITELKPEQVGPFATALRGLGAKI